MATVFMKWLETRPDKYERGIHILTLGRLSHIQEHIASQMVHQGDRALDIGCGTGRLALLMAQRGARVTGVDSSPLMLEEARRKVTAAGLKEQVTLVEMDASALTERFAPHSFDRIVSTLLFSELSGTEQRFVLDECRTLLADGGQLIIVDEVAPEGLLPRLLYGLVRLPLILAVWLLTRATTHPLKEFSPELEAAGFHVESIASFPIANLKLFAAHLASETSYLESSQDISHSHSSNKNFNLRNFPKIIEKMSVEAPAPGKFPQLRHRITWRTLLISVWGLFFRIIPPYPKVQPGLYRVGEPGRDAPVLATGNFALTVHRVVRALDSRANAWLLVVDSAGINVWCAAGGGYLSAAKVITAIKTPGLAQATDSRTLILPQLAANGVDGWKIRRETNWKVRWGPVRAEDIPLYLDSGCEKTDPMRQVSFPLKNRLEMITVTLGFYSLMVLLPIGIFWRDLFWPVAASLAGLSYFYAVAHPRLPGRDGLLKSIPLTLIALAGLLIYTSFYNPLPAPRLFNWAVGLTGLSVFTAAELQGMSPLMRGEQANWGWEAIIGLALGLIYWLTPLALGWR